MISEDWEEFKPCYYQLKMYSADQIARLSRRPTEMINAALSRNVAGNSSDKTQCDAAVSDSQTLCFPRQEKS